MKDNIKESKNSFNAMICDKNSNGIVLIIGYMLGVNFKKINSTERINKEP